MSPSATDHHVGGGFDGDGGGSDGGGFAGGGRGGGDGGGGEGAAGWNSRAGITTVDDSLLAATRKFRTAASTAHVAWESSAPSSSKDTLHSKRRPCTPPPKESAADRVRPLQRERRAGAFSRAIGCRTTPIWPGGETGTELLLQ